MLACAALLGGGAARAAAAQCDCSAASLMGDQVGTRLNNNPNVVNSTVSTAIELPNAGPTLGSAGNAPRWNIDFGVNTIRVDFLQMPATYGVGSKFTFSSLDPKLPGNCPAAHVTGIIVSTNKAIASSIVSTATFTPNSVTLPFVGSSNMDWLPGEYILVRLQFACDNVPPQGGKVNPCCPPWDAAKLGSVLQYQGSGGISAPFTLRFQSSPAVDNPLRAYVAYLHAVNPAITSLSIQFSLLDAGIGPNPGSPTPIPGATFTETWTGAAGALPPTASFPPNVMQVNHWYQVQTVITLNNGITFFPAQCARVNLAVRLQVLPKPAAAAQAGQQPVLEMRTDEGRMLEQRVPTSQQQ
ncbi:MAG TPA: hypothetical protein VF541_10060 [Longimicrobium sp.]